MRTIQLLETEIDQFDSVHTYLCEKLHFPSWYGGNLDALWDCLTGEIELPLHIQWIGLESDRFLSPYSSIISIIHEAAHEINQLQFTYHKG